MEELYTVHTDKITTIVINRPEKLNAFSHDMHKELVQIFERIRGDSDTSVVVVKGVGRSFSAGHDLTQVYTEREPYAIPTATGDERRRGFRTLDQWFSLLWELPQPVVAQVQGYCFNYALELAMNCDFVIAADDAKFVNRSVGGAARLFHLWPYLIGPRKAKEFGMLGEIVSGTEAERLGMINRSVPLDKLEDEVSEFANRLAKIPLELLSLEKKAVNVCLESMNIRTALGYTMELHALSHLTDASQVVTTTLKTDGWKEAWSERDAQRYTS